jgi:hypothetical protein
MSIAAPLSATIQGIIARRSAPTPVGLEAERRCGAQGAISMSETADNLLMVFPSDQGALAHAAVFAAELDWMKVGTASLFRDGCSYRRSPANRSRSRRVSLILQVKKIVGN